MFSVEVVPADHEQVRAADNTSLFDFSCYSEEQDRDKTNQFIFEEDAELSDLEEMLDSTRDFTIPQGRDWLGRGLGATVGMYSVFCIYV